MPLRAKKFDPPPVSKLSNVLHGLGVTRIDHDFDAPANAMSDLLPEELSSRPALKLHQPGDELAVHFSDTQQLKQIGKHLIRWRTEIENQQLHLQSQQQHWTRQMLLEHQAIDQRKTDLDCRERQIKAMEFQLTQLQNDVIDAQVALQQTVVSLTECKQGDQRDGQTIAALMTLRFELHERFDYLVQRWQRFKQQSQA